MNQAPQAAFLPDGRRLHLHDGPIDLIIEAFGPHEEVRIAYRQAIQALEGLLQELVDELRLLRSPVTELEPDPQGSVASLMTEAVRPHRHAFVTPMAAVAGAVADSILKTMIDQRALTRAYVNNGGDIALHLMPGEKFQTGMVTNPTAPSIDGLADIPFEALIRGIATSGWKGRSFSMGIADSVTVLARSAAAADVAATLIANAVDVDHPAVVRSPAFESDPDTDLGDRLITVEVGVLDEESIEIALQSGIGVARDMQARGLIEAASLTLQCQTRVIGQRVPTLDRRVA